MQHLFLPPCSSCSLCLPSLFLSSLFSWAGAIPGFSWHQGRCRPSLGSRVPSCPSAGPQPRIASVSTTNAIFQGALNQVAHICLGLEAGILGEVPALTLPVVLGEISLLSVGPFFPLEKLGSRLAPMPFICHVCIAGAATVKRNTLFSSDPAHPARDQTRHVLGLSGSLRMYVFPERLSFTQQRGLTFKINLRGKVINV